MSVAEWYSGKNVFITGGSGFMGKILIEKLLRSCPNIGKIYFLLRQKREKTPKQRTEDLINAPIFDRIRELGNSEKLFGKLVCIPGDVTIVDLGLSTENLQTLQNEVDIVFHMAANVRFDLSLKQAMLFNTGGTLRLLDIVKYFKNLKSFVHVSTSYCQCDEVVLEEKLYPAPHAPRKILDLVSWMEDDLVNVLSPYLLKNFPNTYSYSKCLTEELLKEYADTIPIAIARPSIVVAAYREPIPGWVENLNGPTGIFVGAGKGVLRSMHCNADLDADLVPVDIVISRLILVARELGQKEHRGEPIVYNLTTDPRNPITWGAVLELGKKHYYNNPFSLCLWYPNGSIKSSFFIHMVAVFFFQLLPAYLLDGILRIIGQKPFLVNTQKRILGGLKVLQYYTTKQWRFVCNNINEASSKLSEEDKENFNTDMSKLNWDNYILDYILGARKFCVRESPETLPKARKLLTKLYILHLAAQLALIAMVFWILYGNFGSIACLVTSMLGYAS